MTTLIDISNWQSSLPMHCVKDAGISGLLVGCQIPSIATDQIHRANDIGIPTYGTYAFLWDEETPTMRTFHAIQVAKANGIPMVWLDVEDGSLMPEQWAQRFADVQACRHLVEDAGLKCGIYTGGPFWRDQMANTEAFSDLPLWHAAYYDDNRKVRYVAYGGWTECAIHQYSSTIDICGQDVDHNYAWTPVWEDEAMTPEEKKRMEDLEKIVARIDNQGIILYTDGQGYDIIQPIRDLNRDVSELKTIVPGSWDAQV